MILCFFSIALLFLFFCLSRQYGVHSFIFIFSTWFGLILIDYSINQLIFEPFSKYFDFIFVYFTVLIFSFYLVVRGLLRDKKLKVLPGNISLISFRSYLIFCWILAAFSICSAAYYFLTKSFFSLREGIIDGSISFHVGVSFPFMASLIFYQRMTERKKFLKLNTFILLVLAFISTSKQFLVLFILYCVPWYKRGFKLRIIYVFILSVCMFCAIMVLHLITERVVGTGNLVEKTLYTINGYLLGGIGVFQLYLDGNLESHITVSPWVRTGEWYGNVYSGFYSFYYNYDLLAFTVKTTMLGVFYGTIKSLRNFFSEFLYVYSVYPLIFFIFSDFYYPSLKQWCGFIVAGLFISIINKNNKINE